MHSLFRRFTLILILVSLALTTQPLFSEGEVETNDDSSQASRTESYAGETSMGPSIIASTSWVAAIVESAGGERVTTLAPNTLKHPPEYDFSPNDIIKATKADLLFWAGYEGFMNQLFEAAEIDESKIIKVNTGYTVELLSENIRRISPLFGKSEEGEKEIEQIQTLFSSLQEKVAQLSESDKQVIVQAHQKPFIQSLGYTIVATIGPGDLSIQDVKDIEQQSFSMIIDNYHSPGGLSFDNEERTYVQLINFPGPFDTQSILSVIQYNGKELGLLDR